MALGAVELSDEVVDSTLGVVLKYEEDVHHVRGEEAGRLLEVARNAA